jgi:hypothetical protein
MEKHVFSFCTSLWLCSVISLTHLFSICIWWNYEGRKYSLKSIALHMRDFRPCFFLKNDLSWENQVGVYTNAVSMKLRSRSWDWSKAIIQSKFRLTASLKHKSWPLSPFQMTFVIRWILAVKTVNFVKRVALNSSLFASVCADLGREHEGLPLHIEVRRLSIQTLLSRL